jgi:hypothetical protein
MLTDDEWREAYSYLLDRLRPIESDSSLILEIQQAAATRVAADLAESELMSATRGEADLVGSEIVLLSSNSNDRRVVREELDLAKYRAPNPREAFVAAASVLITRLREVPAVAERLHILFEREPQNLQWLADAAENEFSPTQESFNARTFSLMVDEKSQIDASLRSLERLLEAEENG